MARQLRASRTVRSHVDDDHVRTHRLNSPSRLIRILDERDVVTPEVQQGREAVSQAGSAGDQDVLAALGVLGTAKAGVGGMRLERHGESLRHSRLLR